MSVLSIQDSNALLLYRVGPVLMCSPTLPVEAVVMPPKITLLPGSNVAEPGAFKSLYGMVRLVDLRVRFGVDDADKLVPGKIIVVEVEGGHAGFWVDEIEDVIGFPATGWSQVSAHIPQDVFTRTLMHKENIRLYADFEQLDKFKATGYLRKHIEVLKQVSKKAFRDDTKSVSSVKNNEVVVEPAKPHESVETHVLGETYVSRDVDVKEDQKHSNKISSENPSGNPSGNSEINEVHGEKTNNTGSFVNKKQSVFSTSIIPSENFNKKGGENKVSEDYSGGEKISKNELNSRGLDINKKIREPRSIRSVSMRAENENENENRKIDLNLKNNQKNNEASQSVVEEKNGVFFVSLIGVAILLATYFMFVFFSAEEDVIQSVAMVQEGSSFEVIDGGALKVERNMLPKKTTVTVQNKRVVEPEFAAGSVEISKSDEGLVIIVNEYAEEIKEDGAVKKMEPEPENIEKVQSENLLDTGEGVNELRLNEPKGGVEAVSNMNDSVELLAVEKQPNVDATSVYIAKGGRSERQGKQSESLGLNESVAENKIAKLTLKRKVLSKKYIHHVIKGDTLWHIAKRYVNNPWRYPELAKLSHIKNPDLIYPGDKVTIIINYKSSQ